MRIDDDRGYFDRQEMIKKWAPCFLSCLLEGYGRYAKYELSYKDNEDLTLRAEVKLMKNVSIETAQVMYNRHIRLMTEKMPSEALICFTTSHYFMSEEDE